MLKIWVRNSHSFTLNICVYLKTCEKSSFFIISCSHDLCLNVKDFFSLPFSNILCSMAIHWNFRLCPCLVSAVVGSC